MRIAEGLEERGKQNEYYYVFTTFRNVIPAVLILFLMISGAFALKSEKTADHKSFYRKSGRIFLPTIVFSIIYLFLESFVYYEAGAYPKDVIGSFSSLCSKG